jgi:sulfhydrogenase subunit alpha
MHQDFDINMEHLSKMEGHANLELKVRKGKVSDIKLQMIENKRFFTQGVRGKPFGSVPQFVSRICGTCSIAHLACSTEAVEKALGIAPSEQTMILRKLSMYSMMIRDHTMHLYFFVLPDMLGVDSVLDLDESKNELIKSAFAIKAAGNNLSTVIAGRAVHPNFDQIGYFSKIPKKEDILRSVNELKSIRGSVLEMIDIFGNCDFSFKRDSEFVAMKTDDFSFLNGSIVSSSGSEMAEEDYWDYLNRVVIPYSEATGFEFEGKEYMIGAISRLNLNQSALHKNTQKDAAKYLSKFPSNDIYHNNMAQAIEVLHSLDHSIEILESRDFKEEPKPEVKMREGKGVGVVEAPRGTLYHMLDLNKEGKVRYANFVIPTAQLQIKMENDIRFMVESILDRKKKDIEHEIAKLIRAYDPCLSCASHFLKVKWS